MATTTITTTPNSAASELTTEALAKLESNLKTGLAARLAARNGTHNKSTSGLAPSCLQANLIVLPSRYADDFRALCARNPVPCPLLAESQSPGDFANLKSYLPTVPSGDRIARQLDLRTDCPNFNIYEDSKLSQECVSDIKS